MSREEVLKLLYQRGAHLFSFHVKRNEADPRKKEYSLRPRWDKQRDTLDLVLGAEHVGLMPGSLGLTAVDVDVKTAKTAPERAKQGHEGCEQVQEWAGKTPCIVRSPSAGAHLFYRADDPDRPKRKLPAKAVTKEPLEVFGTTGFVELYDPVRLVQAPRRPAGVRGRQRSRRDAVETPSSGATMRMVRRVARAARREGHGQWTWTRKTKLGW